MSKTSKDVPKEERRERPRLEPYKREQPKDWQKELTEDEDDS